MALGNVTRPAIRIESNSSSILNVKYRFDHSSSLRTSRGGAENRCKFVHPVSAFCWTNPLVMHWVARRPHIIAIGANCSRSRSACSSFLTIQYLCDSSPADAQIVSERGTARTCRSPRGTGNSEPVSPDHDAVFGAASRWRKPGSIGRIPGWQEKTQGNVHRPKVIRSYLVFGEGVASTSRIW